MLEMPWRLKCKLNWVFWYSYISFIFALKLGSLIMVRMPTHSVQENHFAFKVSKEMCHYLFWSARLVCICFLNVLSYLYLLLSTRFWHCFSWPIFFGCLKWLMNKAFVYFYVYVIHFHNRRVLFDILPSCLIHSFIVCKV